VPARVLPEYAGSAPQTRHGGFGQVDPDDVAAAERRLHGFAFGVLHACDLHIKVAGGVDDFQPVAHREFVARTHLHHAARRIKRHRIAHVQATA